MNVAWTFVQCMPLITICCRNFFQVHCCLAGAAAKFLLAIMQFILPSLFYIRYTIMNTIFATNFWNFIIIRW